VEQSRLKEEERRMLAQFQEEERRVKASRDYMSPVEQAEAIEQIRLRKEEAKVEMTQQKAQLDEQRLVQDGQLEQRRIEIEDEIDNRQQQLEMEEMAAKARYKLAILSLQGAPYRDRVPMPDFNQSSAVVSEKEREFKMRQYDAWQAQRKDEERRLQEVGSLRKAQTSLWLKVKQRRDQKHAQYESRLAALRSKLQAAQLKREIANKSGQLHLQSFAVAGQRRVQDLKLSYYLSQLQKSGQRVNKEALANYKAQISERRKQEDYEAKEAVNRLKYEEKEAIARAKANDAEIKLQLKAQAELATRAARDEAERLSAEQSAGSDQMKAWVTSRRSEEKSVKASLDQWLKYQKEAYAQWKNSQKAAVATESYSSSW
jgi:hypothetical protein